MRLIPPGADPDAPVGARLRPKDETLFARIVNDAFSQRRKMLRKSLAAWVKARRMDGHRRRTHGARGGVDDRSLCRDQRWAFANRA